MPTLIAAGLVISVLPGFLLSRSVAKVVEGSAQETNAMAEGDLTKPVHRSAPLRGDESGDLARSVEAMRKDLDGQLLGIKRSVDGLATVGGEPSESMESEDASMQGMKSSVSEASIQIERQGKGVAETVETVRPMTRTSGDLDGQVEIQAAGSPPSSRSRRWWTTSRPWPRT